MSIESVKFGLGSIKPLPKELDWQKTKIQPGEGQTSFGEMFENAVKDVNAMQNKADKKIEELILEKPGVTTHDAMIALQKADIAFQMMNQVRSKIIRAYEEVIRTQV